MTKEEFPKQEQEPTPEERVAASARAEAEAYLVELKTKAGVERVMFPPPEGITAEEIERNPEKLLSEAQWIEGFIETRVKMWKDSVAESQKRKTVPYLRWDGDAWTLKEEWLSDEDWHWVTLKK